MDERLVLGRISGLFGTRGWLKVISYTRPRENLIEYSPWTVVHGDASCEYAVVEARRHHGNLIVNLDGINDRDRAQELLRGDIVVSRAQLKPAGPGEYYWSDLIGLTVQNLQGQVLGTVAGLVETAAHDVLRVGGERERLIPYVSDVYVKAVDLEQGWIQVDWHIDD